MMGYTHAIAGASGALAYAFSTGSATPATYVIATAAGAIGGIAIDIDVKDNRKNPKVTDASRSRIFVIGLFVICIAIDLLFKLNISSSVIERQYEALIGVIAFIVLLLIGHSTDHRTFTHSLLFVVLTGCCILTILPVALEYYLIGCSLHLIFDMFNYPSHNHGVWLFFPKKGKGIALGWCKAARSGNKVLYFLCLLFFVACTAAFVWKIDNNEDSIGPIIIAIYTIIALHFVRRKSEKEQRHIMHINGEL